jgi:hypothetical protein
VLKAVLEDTYNNSPSVPVANVLFCPEGAAFNSWVPEMKTRTTQAAFISGVKPSLIKATGAYSGDFPIALATVGSVTLAPAASIAGVPPVHTLLCGGGFVPTHSNSGGYSGLLPPSVVDPGVGNDEILTYTYKPRNNTARSSISWLYQEIPEGGAEGRNNSLRGARHGWSLTCPGGDEWMISLEGQSLAALQAKDGSPSLSTSFPVEEPLVGMGAKYALTKIAASAVTYGGGSEASPALAADVYGLEISSNLTTVAKAAPSGTFGVSKINYNAATPTASFTLDKVVFEDDFDINAFTQGRLALRYTQVTPMPGSTTTFLKVAFTGFVTALEDGNEEGYRNTRVTLALGWPEDSADGGGRVPAPILTLQLVTLI